MNIKFTKEEKKFLGKLVLSVGIAWPLGFISSIILSYSIINLFYPKDTNLIVGICLGAVVAFSQWLILRKYFRINVWWIFAATIGMGIPFIVEFILFEFGGNEFNFWGIEIFGPAIVLFLGGILTGLLQFNILKPHTIRHAWWILISALAWGIGWFGFMWGGGIIIGLITGITFLRIFNLPVHGRQIQEEKK